MTPSKEVAALRLALSAYYQKAYGCSVLEGDPCGPDRRRTSEGHFRPVRDPAIGPRYGEKRRVVFVGMNPGADEPESGSDLVTFFDDANPGGWTMASMRQSFRRMAATALGEAPPADKADVSPFVAWVNMVKCGSTPEKESNGNPNYRMWLHCGPKVWSEIELLKPDILIALGEQAHYQLTSGAAHRGLPVRIPRSPWSEFWSEIDLAGRPVGVFCAYHPTGIQSPRAYWNAIKDGAEPRSERVKAFLVDVTGSTAPGDWKKAIEDGSSNDSDSLVDFIEKKFIAPGCARPPSMSQ